MGHRLVVHSVVAGWSRMITGVGRQVLLVPELVLLVAILCLHFMMGASPATTFSGIFVVVWFTCRSLLIIIARQAFNAANYGRVKRLVRLATWLYPYSADVKVLQGMLLIACDRGEQAEEALRRAIALYPGCATLHAIYSGVLIEIGRPADAQREAGWALCLDPACAQAYLHLAHAQQRAGVAPADAELLLRAGLQVRPAPADEAALRCALANCLLEQGRQVEAWLALRGIEALLESCTAPQRAGIHYCLGELRQMMGDTEAALHHFSASETMDPHGRYAAAAWRAARST